MCEISSEGTTVTADPEPLRAVLHEAEVAGLLSLKVWGHSCERPSGAAHAPGDVDHFEIKPEDATTWCLKPKAAPSIETVRGSNLGSYLPAKLIHASPRIQLSWVLTVDMALGVMVPKRPEFFLKRDLPLQPQQVVRVV